MKIYVWAFASGVILFLTLIIMMVIKLVELGNKQTPKEELIVNPIYHETVFYQKPWRVYSFENSEGKFYIAVNDYSYQTTSQTPPTIIKVK